MVEDTVRNPYTTRVSTNKATGNSATVYYNKSGSYVVIDDVTKEVVQISDNINPSTWIPDPSIIDPYKPWLENINDEKLKGFIKFNKYNRDGTYKILQIEWFIQCFK